MSFKKQLFIKEKINIDFDSINSLNFKHKIIRKTDFSITEKEAYESSTRAVVGQYNFSNVILNENKDLGILIVNLLYSKKFGSSFILIIKNVNTNWTVTNVLPLSIY